jgi:hypothetical protein
MAGAIPKTFLAGAALVWRRQRVLWLLYAANILIAFVGTRSIVARTGDILNHSLAAQRLVPGFDLGTYLELSQHPSQPFAGSRPTLVYSALLFTLFMLFTTGGMLTAYYEDRRMTTGDFFRASGEHFWAFLRLMICFAIAIIPVGILAGLTAAAYRRVGHRSISPFPAVHILEAAALLIILLSMCIRLWFDMAQVIAVAEGETRVRRALKISATLLRHNFGSLLWLYARVSLVGGIGFWIGMNVWMRHLPADALRASFVASQALIVFWLATRLWQRASEILWYRQHASALSVPEPVVPPLDVAPAPLEPVATSVSANAGNPPQQIVSPTTRGCDPARFLPDSAS